MRQDSLVAKNVISDFRKTYYKVQLQGSWAKHSNSVALILLACEIARIIIVINSNSNS